MRTKHWLGLLSCGPLLMMAAAVVTAAPSWSQTARLTAGTLTCRGNGTIGLLVGSQQRLACVFDRVGGGSRHEYTARITRVGLDIGITGQNVMIWTVLASSENV